ncbi:MAG: DUF2293 domain-containing protein [Solirubrobacteraceae bacterium]
MPTQILGHSLDRPDLDTGYDELLMSGLDRETARAEVRDSTMRTLGAWRRPSVEDVASSPHPQPTGIGGDQPVRAPSRTA